MRTDHSATHLWRAVRHSIAPLPPTPVLFHVWEWALACRLKRLQTLCGEPNKCDALRCAMSSPKVVKEVTSRYRDDVLFFAGDVKVGKWEDVGCWMPCLRRDFLVDAALPSRPRPHSFLQSGERRAEGWRLLALFLFPRCTTSV